ncbi:polyhydroxyalkanoate synthesis repressor PhaR [Robbsia sp. KACC 23696]|uniref:polyhydroxyalkanoate synthesis repressor PhaR n=1 Tax=Robbsia sp. KACC 23696 TaxID=3149231 RepID=UPI00325C1BFE
MNRKSAEERLIKKYPNRRLYDTQTSTYITLLDVKQLVLEQQVFTVVDARTNEDLTRSILLQIILEEENGGMPMFSSPMLAQMIRFYGNAMQGVMGSYLEQNLKAFTDMQQAFSKQIENAGAEASSQGFPVSPEKWMQMMNPGAPAMQDAMQHYLDQSRDVFGQMQEQWRRQSQGLFSGFPFGAQPPVKPKDSSE